MLSFSGEIERNSPDITCSWTREVNHLLEVAWEDVIQGLSSPTHPVCGAVLRRLIDGLRTVVDLVPEGVISSSGAAYRNLNELWPTWAGWPGPFRDTTGAHAPA